MAHARRAVATCGLRTGVLGIMVMLAAGCGSTAETHLGGAATSYLVRLDHLPSPDFSVIDPAHVVDAAALSRNDATLARAATDQGLEQAATTRFFRSVSSFATANGPIDVVAFSSRFPTAAQAQAYLDAAARSDDAVTGATGISTGPLGDAAHGSVQVAAGPENVKAAEFVVEWRRANVVNTVLVRGRYGAVRLDDALAIARQQDVLESPAGS